MALFSGIKSRMAMLKQSRGDEQTAREQYERLYASGKIDANYLLPYCVILLREGGTENYEKVKEILKKVEKQPGLNTEKKQQIHLDYACAQFKLGHLSEAIQLLERSHQSFRCTNTYAALGYLYVEAGDAEKGLPYCEEALDYDDEDAIFLDNIGQMYYRVLKDKEKALPYFQKAHELKESQIDTLYFLSLYDLENGDVAAAKEKMQKALEGRFSPLNYVTKQLLEEKIKELG